MLAWRGERSSVRAAMSGTRAARATRVVMGDMARKEARDEERESGRRPAAERRRDAAVEPEQEVAVQAQTQSPLRRGPCRTTFADLAPVSPARKPREHGRVSAAADSETRRRAGERQSMVETGSVGIAQGWHSITRRTIASSALQLGNLGLGLDVESLELGLDLGGALLLRLALLDLLLHADLRNHHARRWPLGR